MHASRIIKFVHVVAGDGGFFVGTDSCLLHDAPVCTMHGDLVPKPRVATPSRLGMLAMVTRVMHAWFSRVRACGFELYLRLVFLGPEVGG